MDIVIACPSCGHIKLVGDQFVGRKVVCPKCKTFFAVEDPGNNGSSEPRTSSRDQKNGECVRSAVSTAPAPSPNFAFLICVAPQLTEYATQAEHYFHSDPNTCLMKLRQFAEGLARKIAARSLVNDAVEEDFFLLLTRLQSSRKAPAYVLDAFHYLRMKGNSAVHEQERSRSDALEALKKAHQLAVWFRLAYFPSADYLPQTFKDPTIPPGPLTKQPPPKLDPPRLGKPPPPKPPTVKGPQGGVKQPLKQINRPRETDSGRRTGKPPPTPHALTVSLLILTAMSLLIVVVGVSWIVRRTTSRDQSTQPSLPPAPAIRAVPLVDLGKRELPSRKEEPPALSPLNAKQHVGEWQTVEFTVASTGSSKDRRFVFLNSSRSYRDPNNFTVMLTPEVIGALQAEGVPNVTTYVRGKKIRAQGEISLYQDRAELKVSHREDLRIVTEAER
jgi:hypothetical protein